MTTCSHPTARQQRPSESLGLVGVCSTPPQSGLARGGAREEGGRDETHDDVVALGVWARILCSWVRYRGTRPRACDEVAVTRVSLRTSSNSEGVRFSCLRYCGL